MQMQQQHHTQTRTVERRAYTATMDVQGRMSVSPGPDWNQIRMQSVSTDDMRGVLDHVKSEQRTNAVVDTLAALVYDVNATAEVLRKGSLKRRKKPEVTEYHLDEKVISRSEAPTPRIEVTRITTKSERAIERDYDLPPRTPEVEYRLRITPQPFEEANAMPFPSPRQLETPTEDVYTLERVSSEYGVNVEDTTTSSSKRARSETPKRLIQIEGTPPPAELPICVFCNEHIEGPCITALAPNSYHAQKFHPHHFVCTYCQKALNLRGTYREHDRKPYCHECFYRLYSGLIYAPDEKQKIIQKLI